MTRSTSAPTTSSRRTVLDVVSCLDCLDLGFPDANDPVAGVRLPGAVDRAGAPPILQHLWHLLQLH